MSQETFSDLLIRLEASKGIYVFRPKIDFSPRGKPTVFGQKLPNFEVGIFHSLMSLGISACRKTPFGIIFKCKKRPDKKLKEFLFFHLSTLHLFWAVSLSLVPWET